MSDRPALAALFGADAVDTFLDEYWPARAFAVHADRARLPAALLAEELSSFEALARRYRGTVSFFSGPRSPHMVPVDGLNPDALYRLGLSVYLTDIASCVPAMEGLVRQLEDELGVKPGCGRAAVFASPRTDGIHCHYDAVEVISIQLRGTKRFHIAPVRELPWPWGKQYIPGNVPIDDLYPQVGEAFPDWRDADFETVHMRPGSVLFMPRGTWHRTEADEDSIAVSIGLSVPSAAESVLEALRLALLQDPAWRRPLYGLWGEGAMRDEALARADALLARLGAAAGGLAPGSVRLAQLPENRRIGDVDADSRLRRTPNTRLALDPARADDLIKAHVVTSDQGVERTTATVDMPAHYAPVLEWYADRRGAFRLGEALAAHPALDADAHRELAQTLVATGFLKLLWFPEKGGGDA